MPVRKWSKRLRAWLIFMNYIESLPENMIALVDDDQNISFSTGTNGWFPLPELPLTDPKSWFLDEATSNVDTVTESNGSCCGWPDSVFVIAQRLKTILKCRPDYRPQRWEVSWTGRSLSPALKSWRLYQNFIITSLCLSRKPKWIFGTLVCAYNPSESFFIYRDMQSLLMYGGSLKKNLLDDWERAWVSYTISNKEESTVCAERLLEFQP